MIPLPARMLLVVALVALGGAVFMTAGGGFRMLAGAFSTSFSGFVGKITATPMPSATPFVAAGAPVIALPSEPYTNQPSVDLEITVPSSEIGNTTARLRVYLTLAGQAPTKISEVPMSSTINMVVPVNLAAGRNDFYATIVDGAVESEQSPVVTFILDTEPPKIALTSPTDGGTVNDANATLVGTTQPRTTLLARNATNGASVSGQAGTDGAFSLAVALEPGTNSVTITARDPAGNTGELTISIIRGNGKLTATLSASASRISTSSLPVSIQLNVLVLDPNGMPISGAAVTFTLTAPGIPPISNDAVTGADGRATFTTTLPKDVTEGSGLITAFVSTAQYGTTTAQRTLTVVK